MCSVAMSCWLVAASRATWRCWPRALAAASLTCHLSRRGSYIVKNWCEDGAGSWSGHYWLVRYSILRISHDRKSDIRVRKGQDQHRRVGFGHKRCTNAWTACGWRIDRAFYHEHPPATSVLRSLTFGRIAGTAVATRL